MFTATEYAALILEKGNFVHKKAVGVLSGYIFQKLLLA